LEDSELTECPELPGEIHPSTHAEILNFYEKGKNANSPEFHVDNHSVSVS
jgi:hypothetical protein